MKALLSIVAFAMLAGFCSAQTQEQKDLAAKLQPGTYYWTGKDWAAMQLVNMTGGGTKHMGKVFVPGLTPQMVLTFRDERAPIQFQDGKPIFCVKFLPQYPGVAYGQTSRDIVAVRFDEKKDHRELQITSGGNAFTFKSGFSKDRLPDIDITALDIATFLVSPKNPLAPGEYLLSCSSIGMSGYDFGFHSAK
jgi:hypothetical protein